jgi:diguanylate cyclase (GGDEF)-like protein
VAGKKRVKVTVSIGITLLHAGDTGSDRPLARADAALYRAKRAGRNRVEAELQLTEAV